MSSPTAPPTSETKAKRKYGAPEVDYILLEEDIPANNTSREKKGQVASVVDAKMLARYRVRLTKDITQFDIVFYILTNCESHGIGSVAFDLSDVFTTMPDAEWRELMRTVKEDFGGKVEFSETSHTPRDTPEEVELVRGMAVIEFPKGWAMHPDECRWSGAIDESAKKRLRSIFHSANSSILFSLLANMSNALVQSPYLCDKEARKYVSDLLVGAGYIVQDECDGIIRIGWAHAKKNKTKK
jgi:hypothetical protein